MGSLILWCIQKGQYHNPCPVNWHFSYHINISVYQTLLLLHMFKLKLWVIATSYMMWGQAYDSTLLAFLSYLRFDDWLVFHSGSVVKMAFKKLCSLSPLPGAANSVWGHPLAALSIDSEIALLERSSPDLFLGPVLENSPCFFHKMSLLITKYTLCSFSSGLKGYPYALLHVSFKNYSPSFESWVTPESLTHLELGFSQCSWGQSARRSLKEELLP